MSQPQVVLRVASDPRVLSTVRGAVRGFADANGIDRDTADRVVLAVDEACANTIRHAYGGRSDRLFTLTLRASDRYLEFDVKDGGKPCPESARRKKRPKAPTSIDDVQVGGLGIPLLYEVFDKVEWIAGASRGNRVVMKLRRAQAKKG